MTTDTETRTPTIQELIDTVEEVVSLLKPGYSLWCDLHVSYLAGFDENDSPISWANELQQHSFRFTSGKDFVDFCELVGQMTGLVVEHRDAPESIKAPRFLQIRRFRRKRLVATGRGGIRAE